MAADEDAALCEEDGQWPITAPGTVQTGSCPAGYDGEAKRFCSAQGEWGAEILIGCCGRWARG